MKVQRCLLALQLLCGAGLPLLAGCAQKPANLSLRISIQRYMAIGPIRDSVNPDLSFPSIDVYLPNGQFAYRARSVGEAMRRMQDASATPLQPASFAADGLNDIAVRYPDLKLRPDKLMGRFTVLVISAPGCHACELQEQPLERANLPGNGINEVLLTLGSQ